MEQEDISPEIYELARESLVKLEDNPNLGWREKERLETILGDSYSILCLIKHPKCDEIRDLRMKYLLSQIKPHLLG